MSSVIICPVYGWSYHTTINIITTSEPHFVLTDPRKVAGKHGAGAAAAGKAVHGGHIIGVRSDPALDGGTDLEQHAQGRRRVPRKPKLKNLFFKANSNRKKESKKKKEGLVQATLIS